MLPWRGRATVTKQGTGRMTKRQSLRHEFVEHIPERLEDGALYISLEYATTAHRCACGCGNEVFTPLSPTDWKLIYNGEAVSLKPSIGNWSFPCQSHYWIEEGRIRWAPRWTREQIDRGRELDRVAKEQRDRSDGVAPATEAPAGTRFIARLKRAFRGG